MVIGLVELSETFRALGPRFDVLEEVISNEVWEGLDISKQRFLIAPSRGDLSSSTDLNNYFLENLGPELSANGLLFGQDVEFFSCPIKKYFEGYIYCRADLTFLNEELDSNEVMFNRIADSLKMKLARRNSLREYDILFSEIFDKYSKNLDCYFFPNVEIRDAYLGNEFPFQPYSINSQSSALIVSRQDLKRWI